MLCQGIDHIKFMSKHQVRLLSRPGLSAKTLSSPSQLSESGVKMLQNPVENPESSLESPQFILKFHIFCLVATTKEVRNVYISICFQMFFVSNLIKIGSKSPKIGSNRRNFFLNFIYFRPVKSKRG